MAERRSDVADDPATQDRLDLLTAVNGCKLEQTGH
jgi:hypothetical protein